MEDILRKYIRYALNEKPFNPDLVADLIQLRKASLLSDSQVAGILNEISSRIVKDKGNRIIESDHSFFHCIIQLVLGFNWKIKIPYNHVRRLMNIVYVKILFS